jgi:sec-independent protein translocase protein TatA
MFINDILQPTHLLLILAVALLVLGPKRLPEVGRAVGRSIHDFKRAINGEPRAAQPEQVVSAETAPPAPATAPVTADRAG